MQSNDTPKPKIKSLDAEASNQRYSICVWLLFGRGGVVWCGGSVMVCCTRTNQTMHGLCAVSLTSVWKSHSQGEPLGAKLCLI